MKLFNRNSLFALLEKNDSFVKYTKDDYMYYVKDFYDADERIYNVTARFKDDIYELIIQYRTSDDNEFCHHRESNNPQVDNEDLYVYKTLSYYEKNDQFSTTLTDCLLTVNKDGSWMKKYTFPKYKDTKDLYASIIIYSNGNWEFNYKGVIFLKGGLYQVKENPKILNIELLEKLRAQILNCLLQKKRFKSIKATDFEEAMSSTVSATIQCIEEDYKSWLDLNHYSCFQDVVLTEKQALAIIDVPLEEQTFEKSNKKR